MLRGAFTNPAVTDLPLSDRPGPGGWARTAGRTAVLPVYEAAPTYRAAGCDPVIVVGRNYGAGSSRDWAAKAQTLLGVRAVIAESYERIHRSDLIGTGVLPLEFTDGDSASAHDFTDEGHLTFDGLRNLRVGANPVTLHMHHPDREVRSIPLRLRIFSGQEPACLRHGGILPYAVRRALAVG
ncbi:hypothetical protein GCM10010145_60050 [Streptomyces ruber]|uniref:Aconitase A/isopropylmalate dehydratase small subunit swivel domain-containing protein n=2 Tax=Streptomyces TaxID=1883 RepID=A0A918EXJ0_9ACTN|nr:aconitate hydratase [Streptomyces ruber]GGQ82309.1 hypothetical protein GCM10010145_60050 [Streptomyces ruber]